MHFAWARFELTTLVVIFTDCTDSCKSKYHTITTTTAPNKIGRVGTNVKRFSCYYFLEFFFGERLDSSDSGFHILRFYLLVHICMDAIISIFSMLCLRQIFFGVLFYHFPSILKYAFKKKKKTSWIRQVLSRLKTNIIQIIAAIRNMK